MSTPPFNRMAWRPDLVRTALSEFALNPRGEHGPSHWARVKLHGVRLAHIYGLSPVVPSLFALLHDCCRDNDYHDPEHGLRSSHLVEDLAHRGLLKELSTHEQDCLIQACAQHSDGFLEGPRLVQVCWEADRLDLGRVGIHPNPTLLCTEAAREIAFRAHAYQWSRGRPFSKPANTREIAFSL